MYKHSYCFIFRSAVCTFPTAERIFPTAERTFPIAEYKPNTLNDINSILLSYKLHSYHPYTFIPTIRILSFLPSFSDYFVRPLYAYPPLYTMYFMNFTATTATNAYNTL